MDKSADVFELTKIGTIQDLLDLSDSEWTKMKTDILAYWDGIIIDPSDNQYSKLAFVDLINLMRK